MTIITLTSTASYMENNINNISALIDYLYGDMTQKEKEAFEQKLKNDPVLQKDLNDLKAARKGLSAMGDQEVMDPFVFQAGYASSVWNKTVNRPRYLALKYMVAIAASLAVFFIIGYLTKATLQFDHNTVRLSFGKTSRDKPLTREEIQGMICNEVAVNNRDFINRVNASQAAFNQAIDDHRKTEVAEIRKLFASYTGVKNEELESLASRIQKDNRDLVNEYIQQANAQQQTYVQNVVASFSEYLQKQRTQDLQKIQYSLVNLKESQDMQKMQTSQILTSIITNMNSQNN